MKKIILILLVVLGAFVIKIPKYVELNNLAIIEDVGISYQEGKYYLYLKEVIPTKDDNGISYKYKYYEGVDEELMDSLKQIKGKTKKKLYLKKIKYLITNLDKTDTAKEVLQINPKYILHTKKEILKELKEN